MLGISRYIYLKYVDLPGIIGDRVFYLSDKDKNGHLNFIEFCSVILKINSSDPDIKMKCIFDIFDFDADGKVTAEDVKTIMAYTLSISSLRNKDSVKLSLFSKTSIEKSHEKAEELDKLCTEMFKESSYLCFDKFKKGCEEITSEMFLAV